MTEKLTPQQEAAVNNRGGKLLVSAAAGSGKTKVLVDRLMSFLMDPVRPAELDEFLIITYTKAAAAELRGKIAAKLSQHIAEAPGNRHLQRQMQKLYLAKISTVHSFCSDILREYAYRQELPADFRMVEETESRLLQDQVMEQLLEEAYNKAAADSDIRAFLDSQGLGRDDRKVPDILLQVYRSARCHLNPEKWLSECVEAVDVKDLTDASQTIWGEYLIKDLHRFLDLQMGALMRCAEAAEKSGNMEKPADLLRQTTVQLDALRACETWDEIAKHPGIDFGSLTFKKKDIDAELRDRIKAIRDVCKKELEKKLTRFADSSDGVLQDLQGTGAAVRGLVSLVRSFGTMYDACKRRKRVLDFGDLEHKTLDLLLGESRTVPTEAATEIGRRFREVMVDEYQDSNEVQDAIFDALTYREQNCFTVGDVKQSIYQFRLADPGIFLEKYEKFVPAENAAPGQGRKVVLSRNFRSSGNVLSAVNDVFSVCMSKAVGGLDYTEEEALQEGLPHAPLGEPEVELYALETREDAYAAEADFVAERICTLLDGTHCIREGDLLRPIRAGDIAILLRSPGSAGANFQRALEKRGVRCSFGGDTDLLKTQEVSAFRSVLQIISNPLQDIPLVAAMTSPVFGFTADNLAALRARHPNGELYTAVIADDTAKTKDFLSVLTQLRKEARLLSLNQLLERVLTETRLDSVFSAMPDGEKRIANLQAFCQKAADYESGELRDLDQFLEHLCAIEKKGLMIEGKLGTGAVTITSIHKSKGLEYPVVFLSNLSRQFNWETIKTAPVLCDRDLGLGLSCVDMKNRVRYPSIAKRAIRVKMYTESRSEELRVLYVAMTRARDRLIMTYADKYLEKTLKSLVQRMEFSGSELMASGVNDHGLWVLLAALRRTESGELFELAGKPMQTSFHEPAWSIHLAQPNDETAPTQAETWQPVEPDGDTREHLAEALSFTYGHLQAVQTPSKQTATQLKGRIKDQESASGAPEQRYVARQWRKPSFAGQEAQGKEYGNALHGAMQYIRYAACASLTGVEQEIRRLEREGFLSAEQARLVNCQQIAAFFATDLGKKLRQSENVLREFKFSILDDGERYSPGMEGEKVLLQGVVDCALLEEDGITIVDFKTDYVTEETLGAATERYRTQVQVYGDALSRIYQKKVKERLLYFFRLGRFASLG